MAKDKYTLPVVNSLKEIGFQFEYSRLDEAIPYIKAFIEANIDELILTYFPDQNFYDDDGKLIDVSIWADPNKFDDDLYDDKEKKLIDKIIRIEKGDIHPADYALVVHSKYKNDKAVLLKALNKKLRWIYGATGVLIYRRGIWNLDFADCLKECLYHKVLDDLIKSIIGAGSIKPATWDTRYNKYKEKKAKADKFKKEHDVKKNYLLIVAHYWEADKELMNFSDEIFSSNKTLEKNARLTIRKAQLTGPILSNIEDKEKTISYYLGLQAAEVGKAKDNSKSNKGIQQSKRQRVLDLYIADPKKPIIKIVAEISETTPEMEVTRKTASKYIKDYEMGKNNPVKSTI